MRKYVVSACMLMLMSSLSLANSEGVLVPCSAAWNEWVEQEVGSGDGQGHGPDIGSQEWQQVIQFRLKLNAKQVAKLGSQKWCHEIDMAVRTNQLPR